MLKVPFRQFITDVFVLCQGEKCGGGGSYFKLLFKTLNIILFHFISKGGLSECSGAEVKAWQ